MQQLIRLTQCPVCHRPLAVVTVGRLAHWLDIHDEIGIDLADEHLIWCPGCAIALPPAIPTRRDEVTP